MNTRKISVWLWLVWLAIAAVTPAARGGQTYTFKSRSYEVTTDLARDEADEIVAHMDKVYAEYERRLSKFRVKNAMPVRMYLWETNKGYMDFLASRGINGTNSGGMFFAAGGDSGLTTFVRGQEGARMLHTLQHEGFHQFAFLRIGDTLPVWANEGIAEYFGHGIMVRGQLLLGVLPASELETFRRRHGGELAFTVEEMMTMSGQDWNTRLQTDRARGGLQYDYAWMLCHFLVEADRGKYARAFEQYLVMLSQGRTHDQAFEQAFGTRDYGQVQDAFERYLEHAEPDELSTAKERLEFLGEGLNVLHAEGTRPGTIEEIKAALRAIRFEASRTTHGVVHKYSASDDSMFEPPPSGDARKPRTIEVEPSKDGAMPPSIRITGLRAAVRLIWETGDEDGAVYEVEFK